MQQNDDLKNKIEKLLNTPVSSCSYERDFVLSLEFAECLDIDKHLARTHDSCIAFPEIEQLLEFAPIIELNNATLTGHNILSAPIKVKEKILDAHFFHRDLITNDPSFQIPATFIFSPENTGRLAPTYYVREHAVRNCVANLAKELTKNFNEKIQSGLGELAHYQYSVMQRDIHIYHDINATLGSDFTQTVYDRIDDEDKYAVDWTGLTPKCVLSLNMTDIMHARPVSQDTSNPNFGLDIEFS